ncbi:MAG: hypothetical protein EOO15_03950 [Chitinophagaceae bacterium]|nr:MAG: hypothetical protein EOO15_03950 [Chitinophagaceae bacterium]
MKLSLVNNISAGVLHIVGHFQHLNRHIASTQSQIGSVEHQLLRLKKTALIGTVLSGSGAVGLLALKGPYEEAKRLAQAKADFVALNLSAKENAEAFSVAGTTSQKVLGTTITENIRLVTDLHTAFGDLHHAVAYAPAFAKFLAMAKVRGGEHAGDGLVYNAVKALEHRGGKVVSDSGVFNDELERMSRVYVGSGGRVGPRDYFNASQTGKLAYSLADKDFLYGPFAAYMQAKTGSTASTAMMTAFMSLAGGSMTSKSNDFFGSMGLASSSGKGLREDIVGQYTARPDLFIWNTLVPAIRKRYGMDLTDEQMAEMIARNTNRNTGDFLGWFILNKSKAMKDAAIFGKSMSYTQAYDNYRKTPEGAEQAYHASMVNLKAIIGTAYLPIIVDGLTKLAPALMRMADWAKDHQGFIKGVAAGAALFSTLAILGGGLLLAKAGFGAIALILGGARATAGGMSLATVLPLVARGLGAIGAAAFAFYEVAKLYDAGKQWWDASRRQGVTLTPEAAARVARGDTKDSTFVKPGWRQQLSGGGDVHMDGEKVGRIVTKHQSNAVNRPQTGLSGFDPSMGLAPFALSNLR